MSIVTGIVNEHLLPIMPVSVEKEGNDWQEFNMLLDTGFDGEMALDVSLLNQHCLATQPHRQLLPPDEVLEKWDNWESVAPYTLKMLWRGRHREASLRLLPRQPAFSGIVGTGLLMYQVVTVDVMKGGTATVDSPSSRSESRRTLRRLHRHERQWPSTENEDEYWKWADANLPWTNLPVQDSKGTWHTAWVNVDTGDNGELSLPTSWVTRLGLSLSDESRIRTVRGLEAVLRGEAKVKWQGKERLVECLHREERPPLIGMKLLEGNRVTMDFTAARPAVEIDRLSQSARSKKSLVDSLADILRF